VVAAVLASLLVPSGAYGQSSGVWVTTRAEAQRDLLGERFANIATASCQPDKTSSSGVFAGVRNWQRFWCAGRTRDSVAYRLRYAVTGKCDSCWTVTNLTGTGVNHLRSATTTQPKKTNGSRTGGTSGSCPSGWYKNVYGNCRPGPSADPGLVPGGPSAVCRDGTYSYSQSRSGTCSHHGGVARWL
jgi:hypothetical protein